jgi:hypothetical protein
MIVGSSYTVYRGRGFWSSDAVVELWLHELVAVVDASAAAPAWLREARAEWWVHATVGFTGFVSVGLDQQLSGDPDRGSLFLDLVDRVDARLRSYGPVIAVDVLNGFRVGGDGAVFTRDVDTGLLQDFGAQVADLVRSRNTSG